MSLPLHYTKDPISICYLGNVSFFWTDLRTQIRAIRDSIKPSYLWELSITDSNGIISRCNQNNIDLSGLTIIQYLPFDLHFIGDINMILSSFKKFFKNNYVVDVTPGSRPSVIKISLNKLLKLKSIYNSLLDLNGEPSKNIKLTIDLKDMCLLTGIMLGYPIIYSNSDHDSGNNLSYVPLCVINVRFPNGDTPIYSFSYPHDLSELKSVVKKWINELDEKYPQLIYTEEIRIMPTLLT